MILTDCILLIEPIGFAYNSQTAVDNKFQTDNKSSLAMFQFKSFKSVLEENGVIVRTYSPKDNTTPDAIFPNNWFSTSPDARIMIYPMMTFGKKSRSDRQFDARLPKFRRFIIFGELRPIS